MLWKKKPKVETAETTTDHEITSGETSSVSKAMPLDDDVLKKVVGGTGGQGSNDDPNSENDNESEVFSGYSPGPDWD